MTINLAQYYDRFDVADHYDRHLFRAGNVLQSAELNELQSAAFDRLQRATDVLFKEGDILSGATIVVNKATGVTQLGNGALYLRGAVRGVAPATITIPVIGLVKVGIYLKETVITELQDPDLRDPAVSFRNYQEPGAGRLQVTLSWGYKGDGQEGSFYKIYEVLDGEVITDPAPPTVDTVAQTIARYDRQSTGGFYLSNGLTVTRLADENGSQVFSMADGVARVNGQEIVKQHASRLVYAAVPDTRTVLLEPHLVSGATGEDLRVDVNHQPIHAITDVAMIREVTETLTHGAFSGSLDAITKTPVVQLLSVTQGETTYTVTTDYKLTADKVDWSPGGLEPAPGSSYSITYQYVDTATDPVDADETGFTVPGTVQVAVGGNAAADAELVTGSIVQASYQWSMPRYDLICLNDSGQIITVKGVPAPYRPRVPAVPKSLLNVAVIEQRWGVATRVINNGTRMIPMNELNAVNTRIDTLFALVAEERLALNLTQMDGTAKKGVFTDPFLDDDLRDQGLEQTGAIFEGELTLGVEVVVHSQTLSAPATLDARVLIEIDETVGPEELVISQELRTGSMKVNPYDAFAPLPGVAALFPAVDFWTDFQTNWLSPVTRQFSEELWTNPQTRDRWVAYCLKQKQCDLDGFIRGHTTVVANEVINKAEVEKVGTRYVDLQTLRPIEVRFELAGFGPGEVLNSVFFDGQSVVFAEVI